MAKKLLLNALVKVLGEFIDITEENLNLNVAVWSGQIVFNNLKLKTDKLLQTFNLSILHGVIHRLEVIIPWTALLNSPVKILIDGVYLQFGPLDISKKSKQERRLRSIARKQEKLKLTDKILDYSSTSTDNSDESSKSKDGSPQQSKSSYLQALTAKIIDNLEITLKNVHIRYEDHSSIPNSIISAGITLSSFILAACDEKWKVTYVARGKPSESQNSSNKLHKIAEVKSLALYWNTKSDSLKNLGLTEWIEVMKSQIDRDDGRCLPTENLKYILSPKNSLTIKMTHREDYNEKIPKFHFLIESTNLVLSVDFIHKVQIESIVNKVFHYDQIHQPHFSYRPKYRPGPFDSKKASKAWWQYACKLIIKRPRYVKLIKLVKLNPNISKESEYSMLSIDQRNELMELEEKIPMHTLMLFRQLAYKEIQLERKTVDLKNITQIKKPDVSLTSDESIPKSESNSHKTGWWGWLSNSNDNNVSKSLTSESAKSSNNNLDLLDDVPITAIMDAFEKDNLLPPNIPNQSNSSATKINNVDQITNFILFSIQLNSSASFDLLCDNKHVIKAVMSLRAFSHITTLGLSSQIDLIDISIEDKFTVTPSMKYLLFVKHRSANKYLASESQIRSARSSPLTLTPRSSADKPSSLSICFDNYQGKTTAKVSALPFIFCLNKDCVQMLLSILTSSNPITSSLETANTTLSTNVNNSVDTQINSNDITTNNKSKLIQPGHSDFELIFEADAPKIIIPEHSSSDSGYLLLDTGNLQVKGFIGKSGMSWNIVLRDINAAMPLSVRDINTINDEKKTLYLIKPFDINLAVQSVNKTNADMTVDIEILPELRGELDPKKLARLLHALSAASLTFSVLKNLYVNPLYMEWFKHSSDRSFRLENKEVSADDINQSSGSDINNNLIEVNSQQAFGQYVHTSNINLSQFDTSLLADVLKPSQLESEKILATPVKKLVDLSDVSVTPDSNEIKNKDFSISDQYDKVKQSNDTDASADVDDDLNYGTPPASPSEAMLSSFLTPTASQMVQNSDESTDRAVETSTVFTPVKASLAYEGDNTFINRETRADSEKMDSKSLENNSSSTTVTVDPFRVKYRINYRMPQVVLDLAYDSKQGHHFVLTLIQLSSLIIIRPYDTFMTFNIDGIAIEDSLRSESQRYLAKTPTDSKLVNITYTSMTSNLSSYYKNHASEVIVNFSSLDLNCDVKTISRLKPFMEVLLFMRAGNQYVLASKFIPEPVKTDSFSQNLDMNSDARDTFSKAMGTSHDVNGKNTVVKSIANAIATTVRKSLGTNGLLNSNNSSKSGSPNNVVSESSVNDSQLPVEPRGMIVMMTLDLISLDILRPSTSNLRGELLDNAFSLQISNLRAIIDMKDLLFSDVKLKSFNIFDKREISKDYAFRLIFCPVFSDNDDDSDDEIERLNNLKNSTGRLKHNQSDTNTPNSSYMPARLKDLLHIIYKQESLGLTFMDIVVSNTTSFVAIDAILDFSNVLLANFFAVLDLLALPLPSKLLALHQTYLSHFLIPGSYIPPHLILANQSDSVKNSSTSATQLPAQLQKSPVQSDPLSNMPKINEMKSNNSSPSNYDGIVLPQDTEFEYAVSNTMNISVHVNNPRLVLLDDPNSEESQAIVGRCEIEVHFSRETKKPVTELFDVTSTNINLHESLHLTVKTLEIFVLENINNDESKPVLEPFGLEFHMRKRSCNGLPVSSHMSIDIDGILARVSIRDILLLRSILTRRFLSGNNSNLNTSSDEDSISGDAIYNEYEVNENSQVDLSKVLSTATSTADLSEISDFEINSLEDVNSDNGTDCSDKVVSENLYPSNTANVVTSETTHNFSISITAGAVSLIAIDDHDGKNIPLFHSKFDNTNFYAEGILPSKVLGEGSLICQTDFYHSDLDSWEPVLEKWKPLFYLSLVNNQLFIKVKCKHTLQATISTALLKKILQTYPLFLQQPSSVESNSFDNRFRGNISMSNLNSNLPASNVGVSSNKKNGLSPNSSDYLISDVVVWNKLGADVDLELIDSKSGLKLLKLRGMGDQSFGVVPRLNNCQNRENLNSSRKQNASRDWISVNSLPSAVDIHFEGSLKGKRKPVLHLPFNINKPRLCNLFPLLQQNKALSTTSPVNTSHSDSLNAKSLEAIDNSIANVRNDFQSLGVDSPLPHISTDASTPDTQGPSSVDATVTATTKSKDALTRVNNHPRVIILEPIIEEIYENGRYDPLSGLWRKPFLLGDPEEWTDASGSTSHDPQSINFNENEWEWQDNWSVDMIGSVGVDFDEDGWEYATAFKSFSIASKRRSNLPMDCVRRRRWMRTRIPKSTLINDNVRPLHIFWDVKVMKSGFREVHVRSGLLIKNSMSFPIDVFLYHKSWFSNDSTPVIYGPIESMDMFPVPIMRSYASSIKVRPTQTTSKNGMKVVYVWSNQNIASNIQLYDFSTVSDIICDGLDGGGLQKSLRTITMRAISKQKNKCLTIDFQPYIIMTNALPCDIKYRVSTLDKRKESNSLISGKSGKLNHINMAYETSISLKIGKYNWSKPQLISLSDFNAVNQKISSQSPYLIELELQKPKNSSESVNDSFTSSIGSSISSILGSTVKGDDSDENNRLIVSIATRRNDSCYLELVIYSKYAVIDRTDLDISIWCNINANSAATRRTYNTHSDSVPIDAPLLTSNEGILSSNYKYSINKNTSKQDLQEDFLIESTDNGDDTVTDNSSDLSSTLSVSDQQQQEGGLTLSHPNPWQLNKLPLLNTPKYSKSPRRTTFNAIGNTVIVDALKAESKHKYDLSCVKIGDSVYADNCKLKWTHIPAAIHRNTNAVYIKTSYNDSMSRSKELIKFRLQIPSIVCLFVDRVAANMQCPKWIEEQQFERVVDQAIARKLDDGRLVETYYAIYGKYFDLKQTGEELIVLSGNWNKAKGLMYSVVILPDPRYRDSLTSDFLMSSTSLVSNKSTNYSKSAMISQVNRTPVNYNRRDGKIKTPRTPQLANMDPHRLESIMIHDFIKLLEQINFNSTFDREVANIAWSQGGYSLGLFHSHNDIISVGILRDKIFSNGININPLGSSSYTAGNSNPSSKGFFEIVDWTSKREYQFVYKIEQMPGLFNYTQLFTVMSRYCIVNCIDEPLMIAQRGAIHGQKSFVVQSYHVEPWHKADNRLGNVLHFRTSSTAWSLGVVDINEVGSSELHLPSKATIKQVTGKSNPTADPASPSTDNSRSLNTTPYVIHVEVKEADISEQCSIVIIVWKATVEGRNAPLSIRNDTDVPIVVSQADIYYDLEGYDPYLYEIIVSPKQWIPFGWADPDIGSNILIAAGTALFRSNNRHIATISFLKTGEILRLSDQSGKVGKAGEVLLSIIAQGSGRVLTITREAESKMNRHGYLNSSVLSKFSKGVLKSSINRLNAIGNNQGDRLVKSYSVPNKPAVKIMTSIQVSLTSCGLSLVLDSPVRREFLSLYVDGVEISVTSRGQYMSMELHVMDMQIDNYSESKLYPVLMRSRKKEIHRSIKLSSDDAEGVTVNSNNSSVPDADGNDFLSFNNNNSTKASGEIPLLAISIVQEMPVIADDEASKLSSTELVPTYRYVAVRLLPICIEVDTASIQILLEDMINDLRTILVSNYVPTSALYSSWNGTQAEVSGITANNSGDLPGLSIPGPSSSSGLSSLETMNSSSLKLNSSTVKSNPKFLVLTRNSNQIWLHRFNKDVFSPQERCHKVDVFRAQLVSQISKMYFQKLVVHPIKMYLTVVPTPDYSRSSLVTGRDVNASSTTSFSGAPQDSSNDNSMNISSTLSNMLQSLAAIDRVQLKLRSFEVEDAMETRSSLAYLIGIQLRSDIRDHFAQLFGSLALIGSPVGFARKVGRGVKAFFYEPYQGLVHSPQEFVLGIGKGTSSLVSGVVSGAMNSTANIVNTAAKGISYLSGDSEYIRSRAIKREKNRNSRNGIIDGIIDGGESVLSGISSGMIGVITKPIEEARKDGAYGFFKGIGLGIVGLGVKPIMGLTDGLASLANGISNTVSDVTEFNHVRPQRAFDRSLSDPTDLIIKPLNLDAAFAQDYILSRAKDNNYVDFYITFIPMDIPGEAVILSELYVFWKRSKSLWGRTWANISHCAYFHSEVGIMLYAGSNTSKPEAFSIPCSSPSQAMDLYTALVNNSHRMGNPGLVIPVDMLEYYGLLQENQPAHSNASRTNNINIKDIKDTLIDNLEATNNLEKAKIENELEFENENLQLKYNKLRSIYKYSYMTSNGQSQQHHTLNLAGEIDGYRFGSVNSTKLLRITGPETDIIRRSEYYLKQSYPSLKALDERIWRLIWEWECTHMGLMATRCCVTLILNRSDSPLQIGKVQIIHGKNVMILGSDDTGYEAESRCIQPDGSVVIFMWAFTPTPIELGLIKANIITAEFTATIAGTQRETFCTSYGGLSVGFLEKTVSEWWSKYVILID